MRRLGCVFDSIAEPNALRAAFLAAARGHLFSKEVARFRERLDDEIDWLHQRLCAGSYTVSPYRHFEIRDPKPRKIFAPAFRDRVVHHAILAPCAGRFESALIGDTFACRRGKGTHAAVDRAESFVRRYEYALKLDVAGYFDAIRHDILRRRLARLFKDRRLLDLFATIIASHASAPNRGIPIGALTSQYFANDYLASLDHLVKEGLQAPGYVRYMDDVVVFADDHSRLREILVEMRGAAGTELGLEFKPPQLVACRDGISFLGFRLSHGPRRLTGARRRRFAKVLRRRYEALKAGRLSEAEFGERVTALISHAECAATSGLRRFEMARNERAEIGERCR